MVSKWMRANTANLHRCSAKSKAKQRYLGTVAISWTSLKGWRRFDAEEKHCHSIKKIRQECVWLNY